MKSGQSPRRVNASGFHCYADYLIECGESVLPAGMIPAAFVMTAASFVALLVTAVEAFAVMMSAFVTFPMMVVVIAACRRIIHKRSLCERLCRRVRRALYAAVQPDPGVLKRHLRAHADAAADQCVNALIG